MRLAQMTASALAFASMTILLGCNRPAKEEASISFDLPQFISSEKLSGKVGAQEAADLRLEHVVINASAADMESLFKAWESCHDGCANPELTGPFEFSVKSGSGRLVQLLAVYKSPTTGEISFRYGDVTADLNGGTVTLPIPVTPIATGPVANGQISGRYLTTATSGPTGNVDIKYNPGGGKPKLIVERGSIANGWFSLFSLAGVKLEYVVRESGLVLWGEPIDPTSDVMDPAFNSAANFTRLVRAYMPVHLRQEYHQDNSTTWEPEDAGIYVWGYWAHGGDAMLVAGKSVCTQGLAAQSFTRMKQYAATPGDPLSVTRSGSISTSYPSIAALTNTASPLGDVFIHGGGTSDMTADCNGTADTSANLFSNFQKVNMAKIDGNGKDSLAGFRGVFIIDPDNGSLANVTGTPSVITGKLLPGTNALFPGLRAFKRVAPNQNRIDRVDCQALPAGYVAAGADSTTTADTFSVTTNITATDKAIGTSAILCPLVSTMVPAAAGGAYLDTWNFQGAPSGPPIANVLKVESPQGSETNGAIANTVCTPFKVRGYFNGSPAEIPKNTMLSLSSDSSIAFFSNDQCTPPSLGGYSHMGGSEANLFIKRTITGANTFTVSAVSTGFTTGTSNWTFLDAPGAPTYTLRVKVPATINAYDCYAMTAESWHDDGGTALRVPFDQTYSYNLASISGLNYYSDSECTMGASPSLLMTSSVMTQNLFFKYTNSGTSLNLTPIASGSPTTTVAAPAATTVVQPGTATKLLVEMPNSIPADDCTRVKIRRADASGRSAPGGMITVNLGGTNAQWYTSSSCGMTSSSANIAAGDTFVIRYFRAPTQAPATAVAADSLMTLTQGVANLTVGMPSFTKVLLLYNSQSGNPANPLPSPILTNINYNVDIILQTASGATSSFVSEWLPVNFSGTNVNASPSTPMISFSNGVAALTFNSSVSGPFNGQVSVQRPDGGWVTSVPLASYASPIATQLTMYVQDPSNLVTGGCQLTMVVPEDAQGAALINGWVNFNLTADNGAAFYTDPDCTMAVAPGLMFSSSETFKAYYLKTPSGGPVNVGLTRTGGMLVSNFNGGWFANAGSVGGATAFMVTGRPSSSVVNANRCQPYFVSVADASSRSVPSTNNVVSISANAMAGSPGTLYGSCTGAGLPTSIPSTDGYTVVYMKDMDGMSAATTRIGVSGVLSGATHDVQSAP